MAVSRDPALNFALISVPGDYAAAEAMKALRLGLNVMVFSDNVPDRDEELAIKRSPRERGLLVMGPDCGTAIVNGVPLGFANVVRRGPIGVRRRVGHRPAAGHRLIHNLGAGVSQALGTGGHDLQRSRSAASRCSTGLRALDARCRHQGDRAGLQAAGAGGRRSACSTPPRRCGKPVVVIFLGADPATVSARRRPRREHAGRRGRHARWRSPRARAPTAAIRRSTAGARHARRRRAAHGAGQRYVRGLFSGGTFCYEAQLLLPAPRASRAGPTRRSRANRALDDIRGRAASTRRRHGRRRVHAGPAAPDDRPVAAQRAHRDARRPTRRSR